VTTDRCARGARVQAARPRADQFGQPGFDVERIIFQLRLEDELPSAISFFDLVSPSREFARAVILGG